MNTSSDHDSKSGATVSTGGNQIWADFTWTVATTLTFAAAIKAWNSPRILATDGLLSHPWLLTATIGLEAIIAALIVGSSPHVTRLLIVVAFGCFAAVATYALLAGKDCNCFGLELLGPWFTLPLDLLVLLGSWFLFPNTSSQPLTARRVRFRLLAVIIAVVGIGISQYRISISKSTERLEFLLADDMLGKP